MDLSGKAVGGEKINEPDAQQWVRLARQGNEAAWEELVTYYQAALFRLAYLMLADGAAAEEVVQETFVRAYLHLDRFDTDRPLRPWLFSIAANLARNRRRSLGRYVEAVRRFFQQQPVEIMTPGVDGRFQKQEEARLLWQAVQQLSQPGREVIYLRYFLGFSTAETAETLAIAPGTVKSRSHRALHQLRSIIARDFPALRDGY
jgi:RNA polymerase sigma factor (sigma-70 family)